MKLRSKIPITVKLLWLVMLFGVTIYISNRANISSLQQVNISGTQTQNQLDASLQSNSDENSSPSLALESFRSSYEFTERNPAKSR